MENDKQLALATKNETAIAAATATAIAEIRSCLQLAKMYPRDANESRVKILDTCKRPGFAPHVQYNKPIGNNLIKGISIRGAEVAANNWGNIKSMSGIIFDDAEKRIISVVSMDLETNTSYSSQVIVERVVERNFIKKGQVKLYERTNTKGKPVYGIVPTEDEFQVKVAAQISKQIRNNILRLIPEDIKEEMISTARTTMANLAAKDPQGEIKKIVDAFSTLRVMPNDLKEYLGHDVGKCSPAQIAELRVMYKTIDDGEATWLDYLPVAIDDEGDGTTTEQSSRAKKLKADLAGEEKQPEPPEEGTQEEINAIQEDLRTEGPAEEPKEEPKAPPKKKTTKKALDAQAQRDRVATFIRGNKGLHDELRKHLFLVLPETANVDSYLQYDVLVNPKFMPDAQIELIDKVITENNLYQ